jgi:hypothetical protein
MHHGRIVFGGRLHALDPSALLIDRDYEFFAGCPSRLVQSVVELPKCKKVRSLRVFRKVPGEKRNASGVASFESSSKSIVDRGALEANPEESANVFAKLAVAHWGTIAPQSPEL